MIIFLYGEDSFRSRRKLEEYKNRFLNKYGPEGNLLIIDAEEKSEIRLEAAVRTSGLFSSVQLVIVKNLISRANNEKQSKLVEFMKSDKNITAGKESVLIFWEQESPGKGSPLFKYFQKFSKTQEFPKLKGARLHLWISGRLKEIDPAVKISESAVEKLIAFTGEDLQPIDNELEKLASFKAGGEINEIDIDRLTAAKISTTIFETIEAASGGNKKRALELLHNQLESKEDPFYILSMYVYQFRNLLKIGEHYWKGLSDRFDIAKKTKLHPYVVQKTLPQLKNFTLEKLKNVYQKLQKIDFESKTGKVDIYLALDKFVVEL